MAHLVSQRAEDDLDDIWLYVAKDSQSIDIATRLVETITQRFLLLADFPFIGRSREEDLGPGARTFPVGEYLVIYSFDGSNVSILRVVHGRRDLDDFFPL